MFASNIIIDPSFNLSNYMQFEVFENCLKWVACLHEHTVLALLYRLGSIWKVAQMLAYPNNSCMF